MARQNSLNQNFTLPINASHTHEHPNTMANFPYHEMALSGSMDQNFALPMMNSSHTHEHTNTSGYPMPPSTYHDMAFGDSGIQTQGFPIPMDSSYTEEYTTTSGYHITNSPYLQMGRQNGMNHNFVIQTHPLYSNYQADSSGYAVANAPHLNARTLPDRGPSALGTNIPDRNLTVQLVVPTLANHYAPQTNSMHHIPLHEHTVPVAQFPARTIAASDQMGYADPQEVLWGIHDWNFHFQTRIDTRGHSFIYIHVTEYPVSVKQHETRSTPLHNRCPSRLVVFLRGYIDDLVDRKDKKFECKWCKNEYILDGIAFNHVAQQCHQRSLFCAHCGTKFQSIDDYIQHLERPDLQRLYVNQENNNKKGISKSAPKKGKGEEGDKKRSQIPVLTNESSDIPSATAPGSGRTLESRKQAQDRRGKKAKSRLNN